MSSGREGADRLPPQNREAERSVLGSMLRDNGIIGDVVQLLQKDGRSFYTDAHQKIYLAITHLYDLGQPVDIVILSAELKQRGHLEDVGGYVYVEDLWNAAPTAANAEYYAKIVRDRALVRNLIHAGTEILRDAYDQVLPADELLEGAERKVLEVAEMGVTGQTYTLEEAITQAYDRIDTRHQQGEGMAISGLPTGFNDLDEITAGLQNSEMIIVAARPSVGKCVAHDTEILLADGSVVTMEEVYRRQSARLMTLRDDWKFQSTEPSAYVDDGLKPVYRVTTRLGRVIETTLSHPFRTLEAWTPLANLKPGDVIAVPRELPVFGNDSLPEHKVKLLGYLLGDGGLTDTTPEFTNSNPRLREEFGQSVREFPGVKLREDDGRGVRTPSLAVASDPQFIATHRQEFGKRLKLAIQTKCRTARELAQNLGVAPGNVTLWCQGKCVPNEDLFAKLCVLLGCGEPDLVPVGAAAIRKNGKNPLTLWLSELGLWGKDARTKSIPDLVFRLPREQLALFLNRLFATDGWASLARAGNTQVGYASACERLARQVQHLLLRFGILATIRRREVAYRGQRRECWQLEITGQESIQTFAREIGIFGKEETLEKVRRKVEGNPQRTNRDLIPRAVWADLARAKGERSWANLARELGLGEGANFHVGKRCLSRPKLLRMAQAVGNQKLQQLAESSVYWDAIVSIEPMGLKQVYDLTIPTTHNFVANDVCVHNTAFALNMLRNIVVDHGQKAFFVSLEQSRIELAERLLCCQSRVDSHRLRRGNLTSDDMQKLIDAGGQLRNAQLFIDDSPAQGMLRISANARRLKLRHDIKIVVIDYLQLIEPDNRRDPRQEQVAQISRRLKFLARELSIPVIALAQVNRASEDRQDHRPRLADLRESGSIEQDADTVFLLHRPDRFEPGQHEGIVEVIVGKQRNGPTGEITLMFTKQYMRYDNYVVGTPFDAP